MSKKIKAGALLVGVSLAALCGACGGENRLTHDDGNYATATTTVTPPAPTPNSTEAAKIKSTPHPLSKQ